MSEYELDLPLESEYLAPGSGGISITGGGSGGRMTESGLAFWFRSSGILESLFMVSLLGDCG